jgi:hypothetical protein
MQDHPIASVTCPCCRWGFVAACLTQKASEARVAEQLRAHLQAQHRPGIAVR